ncbi:MAG: LppX LprAFG lipoprotein [Chloroflexota bacterium]|jgi:hypothetical protein|nr:LppX LprAFG lipoprotein [Chloroflexota bacterium]
MPRRILLAVALTATLVAACGTPTAPALTDPKDILVHAVSSLQTLKTVHLKAALAGKVDAGLITGKPSGALIDLAGSTVEGDIDLAGGEAKLSGSVPALLGLSADLVVDGGVIYVRTSLTGPQFQKVDLTALTGVRPVPSLPAASPDPSAVADMLTRLKTELDKLPAPVKLADDKIGDQECYHVQEKLASTDVPQLGAFLGTASGTLTIDVWTRKSDYRPARIAFAVDGGAQGVVTITLDLSGYDAPVTIAPPPADQISNQPFTMPGIPTFP